MSYKPLYTKSAFNDIKKLDTVTKKRIKKKIEALSLNPIVKAKRLVNPIIGTYRWRIGNFRVVFDLDGNKIIILRIGHRREIYK
ncbi:hypothetical protein A2774_01165 [Candidatus Roizmanbacteria bacterium RIFCSPHIGHO2_01_FULL_39_12c]|uniref:Addiction module toxin RelE n=1 Tax=Candidatus Roizmanbacteria bacterium RIFCSPHIGHO2_01_FULL_39_12c TaxID=1802031 RepID=A0A1F7G7U8_9BACT|nr:MAG: hypothetical protein A2774_01165 [Candidatus Roizmanbacteria bacterium RIFCSPHIGHO2_01_FULL_39_12c]OGK46439.1 MAG: hypothetical protein A2963_01570 [Candidatus Roizmanbacteria bacterium RIFCSPLOWO2_01_FULL_40_13]